MSNLVQPVSDIYNDKPTKHVLYLSGNSDVDADDHGEDVHDNLGPLWTQTSMALTYRLYYSHISQKAVPEPCLQQQGLTNKNSLTRIMKNEPDRLGAARILTDYRLDCLVILIKKHHEAASSLKSMNSR